MISSKPKLKETKLSVLVRVPQVGGEQLHEAFVNMQSTQEAIRAFERRWGSLFEDGVIPDWLIEDQKKLRLVWRSAWEIESQKSSLPGELRTRYETAVQGLVPKELATNFAIDKRRIVLTPQNLWDAIALLFHRDRLAHKLAVCANPECPNPYFVRRRKTQIYCQAGPCVGQAQREQKRDWWARNRSKEHR
jgi:hypothetical protein